MTPTRNPDGRLKRPGLTAGAALLAGFVALIIPFKSPSSERPDDVVNAERYDAALSAYEEKRYGEAKRGFETLAKEGVTQAAFMLAVIYEFGDGVEASYSDAAHWYEIAATGGLTSAMTRLGLLYVSGLGVSPDARNARGWLERAARRNDPEALLALGDLHARGHGVTQDLEEAYAYYLLARAVDGEKASAKLRDLEEQMSPGRRQQAEARSRELAARLSSDGLREAAAAPPASTARGAPLVLRPAYVHDRALGLPAVHLLVPDGWRLEGRVAYRSDLASPAVIDVRVESPEHAAYRSLPRASYAWRLVERGGKATPPFIGMRGYVARPPVGDAGVYLEHVVVADLYPSRRPNVQERQNLPGLARVVAADITRRGARGEASAARVRVTYDDAGIAYEEDLYCVLTQIMSSMSGEEIVSWGPERLYALRAPVGMLNSRLALLETIAASMRYDEAWSARYRTLLEELGARPGRSRISEREMDLFLQSARSSGFGSAGHLDRTQEQARVRVNSAIAAELGRTRIYFDPQRQQQVALPTGFAQAWVDAKGGVRLSTGPHDDPARSDPTGGWVELHPVTSRGETID
jgi:hypothetical protein